MKHILFNNLKTLKDFIKDQGGIAIPVSMISSQCDNIELYFLSNDDSINNFSLAKQIETENHILSESGIEIDLDYLNNLKGTHRPFRTENGELQLFYLNEKTDKLYLITP